MYVISERYCAKKVMTGEKTKVNYLNRCFRLYRDGFRSMTVGKTLWKIIFIKLFVMFAVLKLFFFPNYLKTNFSTDDERADYVLNHLTLSGNSGQVSDNINNKNIK